MIKVFASLIKGSEQNISCDPERPLLDLCEDAGIALPYGCRAGACGSCRVQIDVGQELLNEVGPMERDTLDRCHDKNNVRLACRARLKDSSVSGTLRLSSPKDV